MRETVVALIAGLLFGLGLSVSAMIDPAKIMGFLDVFGTWDPSLAFTMAGAVVVSAIAFGLVSRRPAPVFAATFQLPRRTDIDALLLSGTALFGVGWGLAGVCPGPALAQLVLGRWEPFVFVAAMIAGMLLHAASPFGGAAPAASETGD